MIKEGNNMVVESRDSKSFINILKEKALNFESKFKEDHSKALKLHREFLARFPFLEDPSSIENLTKHDVYNLGSGDYFFYRIEHKLKLLGHIAVGSSAPYRNAAENLETFKGLLRML